MGKWIKIVLLGVILPLLVSVVLAYVINFWKSSISADPADWGTFGDYFGGILNPILSIINIGIFIYLTVFLSSIERERADRDIKLQKDFALYSIKHDSIKELNNILEKVQLALLSDNSHPTLTLILIRNELNSFINAYGYLFPSFQAEDKWTLVLNDIIELSEVVEGCKGGEYGDDVVERITNKLDEFHDHKIALLLTTQKDVNLG